LKPPAFQFYPSDWQRDMDDYPLEIEGAWIRICCRLYWSGGVATKTLEEWSRILREKPRKTLLIFDFFLAKNICDLVNQNGSITITSRRIVRDEHIRNIRRLSGSMGGNPILKKTENEENLVNQTVNQKPTPSSSSSSSPSPSPKDIKDFRHTIPPEIDDVKRYCDKRGNLVDAEKFFDFYSAKGWMVGMNKMKDWQAAIRTWEKDNRNGDSGGYSPEGRPKKKWELAMEGKI
jgi:hypothetical protein